MPGAGPTHHPFSLVIAASPHDLQAGGCVRLGAVAALGTRSLLRQRVTLELPCGLAQAGASRAGRAGRERSRSLCVLAREREC